MMKAHDILSKEARERRIFQSFIEVAPLTVLPDSVRSVAPPAPDILCEIQGRGLVAFELVEIVTPEFIREKNNGQKLEKTFKTESQGHPEMKHKFQDAIIHVGFFKTLPINQCLLVVPEVIALLVKQSKNIAGYIPVPNSLQKVVSVIEVHRGIYNGPIFDLMDMTKHTEEIFKQITIKCKTKDYVTEHPLELLAHYTNQPASDGLNWKSECHDYMLRTLVDSKFERVWIFDSWSNTIKYVYPEVGP
jgi:hypothetical protein